MTISGEFRMQLRSGGEFVLPNQFTTFGMQSVLKAAFWGEPQNWEIGLCAHIPADFVALGYINEPPIGVDGYARVAVPLNKQHWSELGNVNGESYIESKVANFQPDPGKTWTPAINRFFITNGVQVIAISSAIPEGLIEVSDVIASPYRLYFR